jgi:ABC-type glycerol-3-phosphate transport system substrate-binding protein
MLSLRVALPLVLVVTTAVLVLCASLVTTPAAIAANCLAQTPISQTATTDVETQAAYAGISTARPGITVVEVRADTFGFAVMQDALARLYTKTSVLLEQGDTVGFDVIVPQAGDYTLALDAVVPATASRAIGQVSIGDMMLTDDFQRIAFPIFYRDSSTTFPKDRYGNDALSRQVRDVRWTTVDVRDVNFSQPYPLRVSLSAGTHRVQFTLTEGTLALGSMYLRLFMPYPDYTEYLAAQSAPEASDISLMLEAEIPAYKNNTSVQATSSRSLTVTPYDTYCQLLNTLGGERWITSGSAVYYRVNVPQDGLYALTFRALQNTRSNFTVFRRITVNGEVPFAQFNAVPFPFTPDWTDITLGSETPYRVFLRQGINELGIEATNAPYLTAIETIQAALLDINTLALEINRLTGNQRDPFREWVISDYIPDIETRVNTIAQNLLDDQDALLSIDERGASREILTYRMAIDNLRFLAADPDSIPLYMSRFSEGTGSAAQQLGSLLPLLQNQPLALDRIYIHAVNRIPQTPGVPFTTAIGEDVRRFLHSFQPDPYRTLTTDDDALVVWVNRPRQHVNLLQLMADTTFTPQTGIRVNFSIMPDESKLVLANAADIEPDVALGVSTNVPYELAIRNALYDLRSFPEFDRFIRIYAPGSLLGYIINESVYALPETQDFWVTFYRQDILDSLGIPVPRTWDDVIEILPELQRFGMNYNAPLSNVTGQRNYLFTAPYLFNYGAQLYSENGFATGLQSDEAVAAIRFMADSFTIYGMPLTTVSFFDGLRYGTLPVGISNAATYMQLTTAAQEINGLWNIDLYPATVLPDGTQNRYTTGSAQISIMFRNTDQPQEAWQFLMWWMSTETQTEFQEQVVLSYGQEFLWFSANLEAFSRLNIPAEHRDIILEQWQWIQEPVRLPGSYMQERELSNIWNRIVFEGVNPRVAIDRSVTIINREITRKMEEFGYLQNGVVVQEFSIPTIETVMAWMESAD